MKKRKENQSRVQRLLNNSGCSALALENQSHSRAWQKQASSTESDANGHKGGCLLQTQWGARCISKPPPDRGVAATACLVLNSIDCMHTTFPEKPKIKAKPSSMRFESESGREYFAEGQRCWFGTLCLGKEHDCFSGVEKYFSPMDMYYLELDPKGTVRLPPHQKQSWILTSQYIKWFILLAVLQLFNNEFW